MVLSIIVIDHEITISPKLGDQIVEYAVNVQAERAGVSLCPSHALLSTVETLLKIEGDHETAPFRPER